MTRPLFFQQRFWPMWTAVSLGAFADNMLRQALIIGVAFGAIRAGGFANPDDAIPIIGSLFAVAILAFSAIAGQIAEKYETAMLFRRIKFAEIILMAFAALGFALNNGWLLIFVLFAMGAQSAFFNPVRMGAMPKYLHANELIRGNGLCNAGLYVSILLGLFMGGMLIARPQGGLIVAGFLLAASIGGWAAILNAPRAGADAPNLKLGWNPAIQSVRLARFAIEAPGVLRPLIGTAFFFYVSTFVTVLMPLYARSALGADDAVATAIMGLFAIGVGLGAGGAAALSKRRSGLGFSAFGILFASLMAFLAYLLTFPAASLAGGGNALTGSVAGLALAVAFCLCAVFMGLFVVPLQAAAQRRAPAERRSRIMAAGNMANATGAILGSLSVLFVTRGLIGPADALLIVACLQAAAALYMLRRRARVQPGLYDDTLLG
jgi:MFS family permease